MSDINYGGPAFPVAADLSTDIPSDPHTGRANGFHVGMTLRDYLAAKAMASYLIPAGPGNTWAASGDYEYIASAAYLMADAMLAERAK